MAGTAEGMAKARAALTERRNAEQRAFIEAWNKADSVEEVAQAFHIEPQSARRRATRARAMGLDVKHMPISKGAHPRLRVGQRVRLGYFVGVVAKRFAATNQVLIVWPDGRAELGTARGRMACGEFVELVSC
jgi:transposase